MGEKLLLELDGRDSQELAFLASSLGFPRQAAALYAVRLVSACIREGLIDDIAMDAWPKEAEPMYISRGKLLDFRGKKAKKGV